MLKKNLSDKSIEQAFFWLLALACTYILYAFNVDRYAALMTDTAGYVDLINSIAAGRGMISPVFSSFYSVWPLLAAQPAVYCGSELLSIHQNTNFAVWHPYLIAYPISAVSAWFGVAPLTVAALVNAINLVGGCGAIYLYLRSRNVPLISSLLFFVSLVAFQPIVGHLNGQFYFDRLLFFPGVLLVLITLGNWLDGRVRVPIVTVLFLACILISERTAIIMSVFMAGYWVLEDRATFARKNLFWLGLSVLGFCYVLLYMKYFQNSLYYSAISFAGALANINSAISSHGPLHAVTIKWLLVLTPFLVLALLRVRTAILVLVVLMPNLVVTVGGAEKTGFLTHYHSAYLPLLVAAAAINFSAIFGRKGTDASSVTEKIWKMSPEGIRSIALAAAITVYNLAINVDSPDTSLRAHGISDIKAEYAPIIPNTSQRKAIVARTEFLNQFVQHIPKDASVSSPEATMPSLVSNGIKLIDYMPIGIGKNDYIIAEVNEVSGNLIIPSYLDESSKLAISRCIQKRLQQEYTIVKTASSGGTAYQLFQKHIE